VNVSIEACDVYIGRPSVFGNPFVIGRDGDRDDVIELYKRYFPRRMGLDPAFREQVLSLKGKKLGCHCKPLSCHGDVIAEYLDKEHI